jgi:hypothetical protein
LAKLAPLTGLKELWLGQTALTDAGLEHLRGLKNLETLEVANTAVTTTGLTRLKAALPSLRD